MEGVPQPVRSVVSGARLSYAMLYITFSATISFRVTYLINLPLVHKCHFLETGSFVTSIDLGRNWTQIPVVAHFLGLRRSFDADNTVEMLTRFEIVAV